MSDKLKEQALRALCLTRDYVGAKLLPSIKGWEWYDSGLALAESMPDSEWSKQFYLRVEGLEDPWISVVDEMPSEGIDILCCNSCEYAPVSARHSTLFSDSYNKNWRAIGTGDIVHFTHWKVLDAPPVTFQVE